MSTSPITDPRNADPCSPETGTAPLLVCLPSLAMGALSDMRDRIAAALPGQPVRIATPEALSASDDAGSIHLVSFPTAAQDGWALTSADYLAAADLTSQHNSAATLVLGVEAASLSAAALRSLASPILSGNADLVLPRYTAGPHDALVSSSLLYPLTRALFSADIHLPLPLDVAFSPRMAARLSVLARRPNLATPESAPLLWPVAEATSAALLVREIDAGDRVLPNHTGDTDLHARLSHVASSLFSDIETRAAFWQRARPIAAPAPRTPPARSISNAQSNTASNTASASDAPTPSSSAAADNSLIPAMAEEFRNAYLNLQEIWSLVLPPHSLLGLKKAAYAPAGSFDLPPDLWARTVYDFVLAWHLRTINRGHLLGSFTPLYLAWVASHLRRSAGDAALSAYHVEQTADAFLTEKPYIVARWRWPDRFNP